MKSCPVCGATYPVDFAVCPRDGTALIEVGSWSDGTVIRGKYRILAKIGQGGMGSVYKALHLAFDEMRALKVMSPELVTNEIFVRRFKQEAVIARKLKHPNAVRVDDIDEAEDGRPFIVMEFIEGQSLKALIRDIGPIPAPRACSIVKQVAAGLGAAHALGMVHRDIKPDNIVLIESPEGEQAKVLDFGIAKLKEARLGAAGGGTLTGTGVVVGTPQYMSPEQAMGKRGDELDGRSDLYSLGIVMYQMLTGELPFKADTSMEMLLAHMQRLPTPIRTLRPGVEIPDGVANLVMKCLEKKRDMRPASAQQLIDELDRAEGAAIPPPSGPPPELRETIIAGRPMGGAQWTTGPKPPSPPPRRQEVRPPVPPPLAIPTAPGYAAGAPQPSPIQPRMTAAPAPEKRGSRWPIAAGLAVLAVGLVVAALVLKSPTRNVSPPVQESPPPTAPVRKPTQQVSPPPASEQPSTQPVEQRPAEKEPQAPSRRERSARVAPERPASRSGLGTIEQPSRGRTEVDSEKVGAQIKLGDFYMDRGDYARAIIAYKEGLKANPSNLILQSRLRRAQKAKAAEGRVLE